MKCVRLKNRNRNHFNVIKKVGLFLVLFMVAMFPKRVEAGSNEFEIKDGVLINYYGDGGSVTIPDTVTSIGKNAFRNCNNLTSVTIPNSVTSIGEAAFMYCINLTNVSIPDSVTSIGEDAFFWCKSLVGVSIPNSVTSIGKAAFFDCIKLTSIVIPASVTYIEDGAFCGCTSLSDITIPTTTTFIGGNVFGDTPWLAKKQKENPWVIINNILVDAELVKGKVTIPNSVSIISGDAFYNNNNVSSITIPDSVTYIGYNAFSDCRELTSIVIPTSVTYIGRGAFSFCKKLTSLVIPASVTYIGNEAFYGCSSLSDITIPTTTTFIGDNAFIDTPWLAKKQKENPLVILNNMIVDAVLAKGKVTIPNTVISIVGRAFQYNDSISSVTIPKGVTNIGDYAFAENSELTSVTFQGSDITFGEDVFYESNETLTFYCASDSTAYEYAKNYEINVKIVDLKLNKESVSIKKGKTYQLQATVYLGDISKQKVTWTSSNKKVVTVSSRGLIKGLKPGKATITALLPNGEKRTCKVVVK